MTDERAQKGKEMIDRLFAGLTRDIPVPEPLRRHTVEHVFGELWQGTELALAERSLITCSVLIATGRASEQRLHFAAARSLGISREKIAAVIDHVAHYAGWPVAIEASGILAEVWPDDASK